MSYTAWVIIASILLLPGIAFFFLPIPTLLYMLAVAVVFGLFDKLTHLSGVELIILAGITALSVMADILSGLLGAKWGGAHWSSVWWGALGLILGSILIPIPIFGGIIGMIVAVIGSELYRTNNLQAAKKAAVGSLLGSLAGAGLKLIASVAFLVLFIIFALN